MESRFVKHGDGQTTSSGWGQLRGISTLATGATDVLVLEVTLQPGEGRDFHKHPHQEEIVYVLDGELSQWLDQDEQVLSTGDSAYISAGTVHASTNKTDGVVRYLAVLAPIIGEQGVETVHVADQEPWASLIR